MRCDSLMVQVVISQIDHESLGGWAGRSGVGGVGGREAEQTFKHKWQCCAMSK